MSNKLAEAVEVPPITSQPHRHPDEKLYEPDAAKYLGVSRSTLRNLRRDKLIGYYRYNSKSYYSVAQLEAYRNRHEVKPVTGKTRGYGNLRLAK